MENGEVGADLGFQEASAQLIRPQPVSSTHGQIGRRGEEGVCVCVCVYVRERGRKREENPADKAVGECQSDFMDSREDISWTPLDSEPILCLNAAPA